MSHPTMGAWIEIKIKRYARKGRDYVAPHDGCVD